MYPIWSKIAANHYTYAKFYGCDRLVILWLPIPVIVVRFLKVLVWFSNIILLSFLKSCQKPVTAIWDPSLKSHVVIPDSYFLEKVETSFNFIGEKKVSVGGKKVSVGSQQTLFFPIGSQQTLFSPSDLLPCRLVTMRCRDWWHWSDMILRMISWSTAPMVLK